MGTTPSKDGDILSIAELLDSIVSKVIADENGLRSFDLPRNISKANTVTIEKEMNDPMRSFKGVATDIVVEEFFKSETSLYRFMTLVYRLFDKSLNIYRKKRRISEDMLFFLYKGGNVLRIVSSEFLLQLPANATREINKFYSKFFKRSDADFTIYLSPTVENYDQVFYELALLSYLIQVEIRKQFVDRSMYYFDFATRHSEYKDQVLNSYLNEFNKLDERTFDSLIVGNGKTPINSESKYETFPDVAIRFADENFGEDLRYGFINEIQKDNSPFRITYNTALDFPSGSKEERRTKFALVRTKVEFNLWSGDEVIHVGGELIDVSIGHRQDSGIRHFFQHVKESVTTYKLKYEDKILTFKSYTLKYLTEDLETILFKFNKFPWDDNKYQKRINRLFYLYFVDIFIKIEGGAERLEILEFIRNKIFKTFATSVYKKRENRLAANLREFKDRYGSFDLNIINLTTLFSRLFVNLDSGNIASMKEMNKLLQKNADIIIDSIQDIMQYCTVDGIVSAGDISDTDTRILL